MLHLPRLSERTTLRVASRVAAAGIVSLFGAAMLLQRQPALSDPVGGSAVVSVTMVDWPTPPAPPRVGRRVIRREATTTAPMAAAPVEAQIGGDGGGPSLWFDGPNGRIAFRDSAHYLRCLDAVLERVDVEGCPKASDLPPLGG